VKQRAAALGLEGNLAILNAGASPGHSETICRIEILDLTSWWLISCSTGCYSSKD